MFDELDKKNNLKEDIAKIESENILNENKEPTPSTSLEEGVEDIFSGGDDNVENSAREEPEYNEGKNKPEVFAPVDKNRKQEQTQAKTKKSFPWIKISIIIFIFIVVFGGGYFAYQKYFKNIIFSKNNPETQDIIEVPVEDENINNENTSATEVLNTNQTEIIKNENTVKTPVSLKDTDGDGLSDIKEMELGLNINSIDTDQDGLFDREEVMVYGTDATNPDTDGDGFLDGAEVKAGYNPNGAGNLYTPNEAIK